MKNQEYSGQVAEVAGEGIDTPAESVLTVAKATTGLKAFCADSPGHRIYLIFGCNPVHIEFVENKVDVFKRVQSFNEESTVHHISLAMACDMIEMAENPSFKHDDPG